MNSQELETVVREHVPLVVLVLVDEEYGCPGARPPKSGAVALPTT
ncbi:MULTISPECIES: hypothetical protein [Streptomyces]|uniref:Uncharacterized protein n=1 Tax=Streptomyces silvisoli TaxID=3034235 RepID=A0ABT5ZRP4_9ACTN|nr:hypothetical protein [Streptomyces sp. RPT161]MDF3292490.1 hypothetical protein [Streptomyces silvisoli]